MRVLWLVMGLGISIQAVNERNFLMLLPALYFVFGAIANVGCFSGTCATGFASNPATSEKKEGITEIEYEEVKN
jgi:hypothetical protein